MYRTPGEATSRRARSEAAPTREVCKGCGVVAPAQGTSCVVCGERLAESRVEVVIPRLGALGDAAGDDANANADLAFWVAVRATFVCNSCRFAAPLDGLDADGAVECACCGLRQRFEIGAWPRALAFAHAVADLAGPGAEGCQPHPTLWIGSENPHARVGDTVAFEKTGEISESKLSLDVAPGHPVCRTCHVPIVTTRQGAGVIVNQCPRCSDRAVFALPAEARKLAPNVVAAAATEHRTDRPRAKATMTHAGVEALTCPSCGAPLHVTAVGRIQTCTFCHATCILPSGRLAHQGANPAPELWWILFHGRSAKRAELESPVAANSVANAVKAAIETMKPPSADTTPIGEEPGVYAAPEIPGVYWPQVLLTLVLGSVATLLGLAIYRVVLH